MTNDNLMMFIRYGISIVASFALGKGWIAAGQDAAITDALVKIAGSLVAVIPPLWAAFRVNNAPKP